MFLFSVHIRDPNNVTHSIHNLRISASDMALPPPQQNLIKKQLNDTVASTYGQSQEMGANSMTSIGNYDLQFSGKIMYCLFLLIVAQSANKVSNFALTLHLQQRGCPQSKLIILLIFLKLQTLFLFAAVDIRGTQVSTWQG